MASFQIKCCRDQTFKFQFFNKTSNPLSNTENLQTTIFRKIKKRRRKQPKIKLNVKIVQLGSKRRESGSTCRRSGRSKRAYPHFTGGPLTLFLSFSTKQTKGGPGFSLEVLPVSPCHSLFEKKKNQILPRRDINDEGIWGRLAGSAQADPTSLTNTALSS